MEKLRGGDENGVAMVEDGGGTVAFCARLDGDGGGVMDARVRCCHGEEGALLRWCCGGALVSIAARGGVVVLRWQFRWLR